GKLAWSKDVEKDLGGRRPQYGFCTSPLITDKAVILDVGPNIAIDKTNGNTLWKEGGGEPSYGSPVPFKVGSQSLLATFKPSGLVVVDGSDGKSVSSYEWRTSYNVNAATPIISGNNVFISSGYGHGCSLISVADGKASKVYENKDMMNQYTSSVGYNGYIY